MILNRSAILIIPKQPFAEWADGTDSEGPRFELSEEDDDLTVFLGPEFDSNDRALAWVHKNFDLFFEEWLQSWSLDESQWPSPRTLKMFKLWFTVRIHSMVVDTIEAPFMLE